MRWRPKGDYIAECLELGMLYIEGSPEKAQDMLDEGIKVYVEAANRFAQQGKLFRITRAQGYWLKRCK